jgi:hypothetical protein
LQIFVEKCTVDGKSGSVKYEAQELNMQSREDKLKIWVDRYRKAHPRSRASKPYCREQNGSIKRVYRSLVDGSQISMCAQYPIPKRVLAWMLEQEEAAIAEVDAQK